MDRKEEINLINQVLDSFKVGHSDIRVTAGPSVALYEFYPAIGVRMSKIRNLRDEFAAVLKTGGVRVIAPIPEKGTVGIEVPNREREIVPIDEMLQSEEYLNSTMALPLALGKTVLGDNFIADLADMPHLLIAGATGQGKSVGLNVILASLLRKRTPDELKLVLVAPKQVELTPYEDIAKPYLLHIDGFAPICTAPESAQQTLNGIIDIMEERYTMLKTKGVRNIAEYNKVSSDKMQYIVVVVDEYGDLVMTADSEMERSICRLAQKARAVGIHLIISTQRPDVSIVTGNIKANFPTRIAFRTTTGTDSRVILDRIGAERLTGKGDMLFFSGADTERVQCAYISTDEVVTMCREIKAKYDNCAEMMMPDKVKIAQELALQREMEDRERRRKEIMRPCYDTLDLALLVADYHYISLDVHKEIERRLGHKPNGISWIRLHDYGIIDCITRPTVLIRDKDKIREIIDYYSS